MLATELAVLALTLTRAQLTVYDLSKQLTAGMVLQKNDINNL